MVLIARLDVVAGEEAGDAVQNALPPAVVVLAQDVDDGVLLEAQLVLFIRVVIVHGHNCKNKNENFNYPQSFSII